jgi:hypothetical protein
MPLPPRMHTALGAERHPPSVLRVSILARNDMKDSDRVNLETI